MTDNKTDNNVGISYVRDLDDFRGHAALYRLSVAIPYRQLNKHDSDDYEDWTHDHFSTNYVVISAAIVPMSGPEVLIFPADWDGNVIDWCEVAGLRGTLDHGEAIISAGWHLTNE